jgi:hypothetical protein
LAAAEAVIGLGRAKNSEHDAFITVIQDQIVGKSPDFPRSEAIIREFIAPFEDGESRQTDNS